MQDTSKVYSSNFPDPLLPKDKKEQKEYGLRYAKAIEAQWGNADNSNSIFRKRNKIFDRNREYANGTQDTTIYKQILTSLDPNNGDGSLVNLDFTAVPILSKFARIVVNKILSKKPYPNLEAVDPISQSEKNREKKSMENQIKNRQDLIELKQMTGGAQMGGVDPEQLPETTEEMEMLFDTNVRTAAEMAAQIGAHMTLEWNDYVDGTYRRCVNDLVSVGMAVTRRVNDPSYGISLEYVDPGMFIHSFTEDPNFEDLVYAGHIRKIPISELKRMAGESLSEDDLKKVQKVAKQNKNDVWTNPNSTYYDEFTNKHTNGYEEYMVTIMDFEFISTDTMNYEEKENRFGNTNFFYKGFGNKEKKYMGGVFERVPHRMDIENVYCGTYIMGTDVIFNYGLKANMPRNIHDLSKTRLSYSVVATNMRNMIPKSMVDGCIGFADMLQITHLKLQQAIAKAKPDGLVIDIEGLENVQLGQGGELQPLELHDIYEQTGVFYYRSKNPEGGFQNPPVREINNSIRNINELIGLYNHYLRMIRDATGINEVMDATTPKGEDLVGVREQALAAGNNAIYDITNSSMVLFKKVTQDIVKCLQILPKGSPVYEAYERAIGEEAVDVLSSFSELPMYNFGVTVQKDMEDAEKAYLEQNIQMSIAQKELDIEDAILLRNMKDITQAERMLVIRRNKRIKRNQEIAQQNSQMQMQQAAQAAQVKTQGTVQEIQAKGQVDVQEMQLKYQLEMQLEQLKHQHRREIEMIRAQATLGFKEEEQNFKEKLEVLKETKKDERAEAQAANQEKAMVQKAVMDQAMQQQQQQPDGEQGQL
jgi:hypothetical protein